MNHGPAPSPTSAPRRIRPCAIGPRIFWLGLAAAVVWAAGSVRADEQGVEWFEKKIRPVLVEHCYECHSAGAKKPQAGLRLDSPGGIRQGGDSGPLLAAGKPDESLLFQAVAYTGDASEMPPTGKLPQGVIADFRRWIEQGANLPAGSDPAPVAAAAARPIAEQREFWSFRPVRQFAPPAVSQPHWPRTKLDHFVLAQLDARQLFPAPEADRRTLVRRLYFDLVGLPPSWEEVEAFVADPASDAYERLVERLLASPHHGERWARHWLDVARYAEDNPTSEATSRAPRFPFRYRDWVIRALNEDLPYDEFVRRQLAADRMNLPPTEIAALGFLGLSPVYHKEPKLSGDVISVIVADEWDERLDTITRGLLGLTVACARCHDHKFDPITMQDYYALAGVMASTQLVEWPVVATSPEEASALTEVQRQIVDGNLRLSYAKEMRDTAQASGQDTAPFERAVAEIGAAVERLKETPLFDGPIANAVRDAGLWVNGDDPSWTVLDFRPDQPRDLPVFLRGSVTNPGPIAPRRFIEVLSADPPRPFVDGSGRRELAECIVRDAAPLAARVIVNRLWGWHFGRPLVETPSNFGRQGGRPSHPELLDDLAARFIAAGWSLRWLHREIVCSATYRQASVNSVCDGSIDADNRLLWRMNLRRLEAEPWRDAMLAVIGELDLSLGGPSKSLNEADNFRRTIYGTVSRQQPADLLRLFDFPDAKTHGEERVLTTTPLQQLYLLNSPFVRHRAEAVVSRWLPDSDAARPRPAIRELYRRVLLREPTPQEIKAAQRLIRGADQQTPSGWAVLAHALLASNEFLYVD